MSKAADRSDVLYFNNPTAIAVVALGGLKVESERFFESFLEAGGVSALVSVLRETDCPVTLFYTTAVIHRLLESQVGLRETPSWCSEFADRFLQAGESGACLHPHLEPHQHPNPT
jgi:hypothetical protein